MRASDSERHGMELRHWERTWRLVIAGVVLVTATWLLFHLIGIRLPAEMVLGGIVTILGLAYFLQQQHLQQAEFFKELVTEFNRRYNRLNDDLLRSLKDGQPFDEQKFVDYFNLCAEEWLFYKTGYIYGPVWQAWRNGMKQFGNDARVAKLWQQENQTNSYYGFEFPVEITRQGERKK
jgi:hypothetical protein